MERIKCECGHVNPYGTELCEACGKPLQKEVADQKMVDMRYEGSARRSKVYNTTIVDKVWNYFSSVKVGITLIVLVLITASFGTIFPQQYFIPQGADPSHYYEDKYGLAGRVYYNLGFYHLYGSWWFVLLLGLLGLSIIVASLDRGLPLYRALKNQAVTRHDSFMKRQRLFGITEVLQPGQAIENVKRNLESHKYHVKMENGNLFAEKNRFSRWGPYVNHVGLILVLLGGMLRAVPGMYIDDTVWVKEGETVAIPGTNNQYYIKNDKFLLQVYDKNKDQQFKSALNRVGGPVAKNYQSNVTLYKAVGENIPGEKPKLEKVTDYGIRVNHPLKFDGYAIYQVDYQMNLFSQMSFQLTNKQTGEGLGVINVDLNNPQKQYDLGNGNKIVLREFLPDYYTNDQGMPATKSRTPNNPAFVFEMFTPQTPEGEISFVGIRKNVEPKGENQYKMKFAGIKTINSSILAVKRDYTLGIVIAGAIIFMIGVIQGMYWNHRRIWVKRSGTQLWMSAHTNKNWHGLTRELEEITTASSLAMPTDQAEKKL